MKLLTQEESKNLKVGQVVNVTWWSPRKDKLRPNAPTREHGGRTEYLESVWENEVVAQTPWLTASDGYGVSLAGRPNALYLTSKMELVK